MKRKEIKSNEREGKATGKRKEREGKEREKRKG